jgi:hypothetical protein
MGRCLSLPSGDYLLASQSEDDRYLFGCQSAQVTATVALSVGARSKPSLPLGMARRWRGACKHLRTGYP